MSFFCRTLLLPSTPLSSLPSHRSHLISLVVAVLRSFYSHCRCPKVLPFFQTPICLWLRASTSHCSFCNLASHVHVAPLTLTSSPNVVVVVPLHGRHPSSIVVSPPPLSMSSLHDRDALSFITAFESCMIARRLFLCCLLHTTTSTAPVITSSHFFRATG